MGLSGGELIPITLKGKLYKTIAKPVMLYGTKCWNIKEKHVNTIECSSNENVEEDVW